MTIVIMARRKPSTLRLRFQYLAHDGFVADHVAVPVTGLPRKPRRRPVLLG